MELLVTSARFRDSSIALCRGTALVHGACLGTSGARERTILPSRAAVIRLRRLSGVWAMSLVCVK